MTVQGFNLQPELSGPSATLRPIRTDDFNGLYQCSSDPRVWAGHPATDRHEKDVFLKWFDSAMAAKALVLVDTTTNTIMGSSRYYTVDTAPGDIAIGFTFLGFEFWGGKVNRELKGLMLAHAFNCFDTVWFHIDLTNLRSQAAIQKIGAEFVRDEVNSLSTNAEVWKCYRISKESWIAAHHE